MTSVNTLLANKLAIGCSKKKSPARKSLYLLVNHEQEVSNPFNLQSESSVMLRI